MLRNLFPLLIGILTWFIAITANAGNCDGSYSISYTPITLSTTIGTTLSITVTASPTNKSYEFELKPVNNSTFQGYFNPRDGVPAGEWKSQKITTSVGSPSVTFTYTPPASLPSPAQSGLFEIKVKNKTGTDCDIKPGGNWPTDNIALFASCATPITWNQTIPALSVVAGNTLSWTPTGTLASGGSGSITYSAIINTLSPDAGSLTINASTGAFSYASGSGYSGDYSFTLKATAGTCTATQDVTVNVQAVTACNAPNLPNFSISTPAGTAYTATPTVNGGSTPYTFSISSAPTHGTLVLNDATTGNYTYTPAGGYSGTDSFALTAASTCGTSPGTTATASVTVGAPASSCVAPTISAISFTIPSGTTSYSFTPTVSGGTTPYIFSLPSTTTAHGTVSINSGTGLVTYTPTTGYSGADSFAINVASSCGGNPTVSTTAAATISSANVTGTIGASVGTIVNSGAIIIDNTPNPGTPGIVTNMSTNVGGKNFGAGNAFNIDGIQVMQRDNTVTPHRLIDEAGVTNTVSTSYQNYGTARQTTYFANGQHLFDLDRLRKAANWLHVPTGVTVPDATSGNTAYLNTGVGVDQKTAIVTPPASCTTYAAVASGTPIGLPVGSCHPEGTFGTITWAQFLDNIKNSRTMYGVVRILVPLKLGAAASSNNALNQTVGTSQIYGFCNVTTEWCANSPTSSTDIKPNATVAGNNSVAVTIPVSGQLKVRGTLMFDFVNGTTDAVYGAPGHPIGLDHLPFQPRDIYFKVSIPINVNAANDKTGDGVLDNIDYISGVSSHITCPSYPCTTVIPADGTGNSPVIDPAQVPQEAVNAYNYQYGTSYPNNSDAAFITQFNSLNKPSQYHMLMAPGYVQGWYDAFQELGITAQEWSNLGFTVPPSANMSQPLTLNDLRSNSFEDIPVYFYTGGLVDMHHHMNISGLIYVPQAAEIEQKQATTRMYMMGGVIVRDGFFLEGKSGGITLISSDPQSFSSIRVLAGAIQGAMLSAATSTLHDASAATSTPLGVGMGGGGGGGGGGGTPGSSCVGCGGNTVSVGKVRWVEIRPQ